MYDDLDGLPIYGFRGFLTGAISGGGEYPNPYPPPSWFQPINVPVQPCDPAWPWFPDCGIVDQVQKLGEVSAAATMSLDTVIACVQFPDTGEFGAQILHFWPLTWTIGAPQHSGSGQFVESVICPDPSAPNPNVKPWPNPWGYARTEVDVLGGGQGPPDLSNQLVLRGCVRGPWNNPSFEETSIYQYASQYAGAFGYQQFVPPFFVPICEWDITIGEWTVTRTMQLALTVV